MATEVNDFTLELARCGLRVQSVAHSWANSKSSISKDEETGLASALYQIAVDAVAMYNTLPSVKSGEDARLIVAMPVGGVR